MTPRILRAAVAVVLLAVALSGCGVRLASVRDGYGSDVMLLGHDPVAYFTEGRPARGDPALKADHDGVTYYFANTAHRAMFVADPAKYAPQYGAFCASGAAYGVKLGSDPSEWRIRDGRLFIFGDVLGREYWLLDPAWHVEKADAMWASETGLHGHRYQSLKRLVFRVPWYKTGREVHAEWQAAHPGQNLTYDPGGIVTNLFLKYPGWRAAEGYGQPALGIPGVPAPGGR